MYLVYTCDAHHTHQSKTIIAVSNRKEKAIKLIKEFANNEDYTISEHQLYLLDSINQTQDYEGNGEFMIEEIELNKLF